MKINKPVLAIIVLIIDLILAFLFVLPKYRDSNNLEISLYKKQKEYSDQLDYNMKLSEALEGIEKRQDALQKVDSALPSDFSLAAVVNFLQERASDNRLAVKSISYSAVLPAFYQRVLANDHSKELRNIVFAIDLSGSYRSFKNFLFSLERSSRLFETDNVSFVSKSELGKGFLQNQSENYDFKLELRTYTY